MLLEAGNYGCTNDMVTVVACMAVPQIFMWSKESTTDEDATKVQFADPDIEYVMLLNVYAVELVAGRKRWCWENFINDRSLQSADNVRRHLTRIMSKMELPLVRMSRWCVSRGMGSTSPSGTIRSSTYILAWLSISSRTGLYSRNLHSCPIIISGPLASRAWTG